MRFSLLCVKSRPCEILKPYCIVFAHQGNLACRFMVMINCFITIKIIRTVGDKVCFVLRPPRYYGPIFCPGQWPHSELPVCIILVNFIPFVRSRTSHAHLSNVNVTTVWTECTDSIFFKKIISALPYVY